MRHRPKSRSPEGLSGWVFTFIFDSVYSTLFLDCLKLRNFQNPSKIVATVDALEYDYFMSFMFHVSEAMDVYIIFSVRLLLLLVPTDSGNAKASSSGTSDEYGSPTL